MHFSTSIFILISGTLYAQIFYSEIFKCLECIFQVLFVKSLKYIWCKFCIMIREIMFELHLLMVLFGTNLVSNISIKILNKHHINFWCKTGANLVGQTQKLVYQRLSYFKILDVQIHMSPKFRNPNRSINETSSTLAFNILNYIAGKNITDFYLWFKHYEFH